MLRRFFELVIALQVALLFACGSDTSNRLNGERIELPLDYSLRLYCPDVGIHEEDCILEDPNNPYARAAVNDETKWDLGAASPSAKSDFYLWATAQARSPRGENQYYTAVALHKLYSQGGAELAREQAKRAYRAVLDNYFGAVTFYIIETPSGDRKLPQSLRLLVGERIFKAVGRELAPLYETELDARAALGEWGYTYNSSSGQIDLSR